MEFTMFIRSVLLALLCFAMLPLHATTYTLEADYTQGVFRWDHLGFSTPAAQVSQGEGSLQFDPADPLHASVQVTIPLSTLNTGVPGLDEHLRSADFFDVTHYPTAAFKSTMVAKGEGKRLKVTGDLTLHGITKPVVLDVVMVKIGTNPRSNLPTIGFDGSAKIRRSSFGLGKFVPQVSDEITLHLTTQAVEAKAYAEAKRAEAAEEAAKTRKQ
jgi:polyisoprenoid-binding protein YceI